MKLHSLAASHLVTREPSRCQTSILNGVAGFVGGAVGAFIYNIVAGMVGGISLEIEV